MTYEELKREISSRSISQLPGLLQHVARLCGIKPIFKDREAFLSFVSRAYDMGLAGEAELRNCHSGSMNPRSLQAANEAVAKLKKEGHL